MQTVDIETGEILRLSDDEQQQLERFEVAIARGLRTFVEVGEALLSIRDRRLYRANYRTFEDYCRDRWSMARRTAYQLMDAAGVVENVRNCAQALPANEAQVRPLAMLQPDEQRLVWQVVQDTAPAGKVTAAHVKSVVSVLKEVTTTGAIDNGEGLSIPVRRATTEHMKAAVTEETAERLRRQEAYVAEKLKNKSSIIFSSDSVEWYTPSKYVEAARVVMGGIDLDPASCEEAQRVVQAAAYFTAGDDGLSQDWHGRVWLNPPYGTDGGGSVAGVWVARLVDAYRSGQVTAAVLLVNAVTDRKWFQPLWDFPVCFTDHRIKFNTPNGTPDSPIAGSAIVYFGEDVTGFVRAFSPFGVVAGRLHDQPVW